MQALFVAIVILVGLAVLVPIIFMVAALFRTVVATFRPIEQAPNADESGSSEGADGPGPVGGP